MEKQKALDMAQPKLKSNLAEGSIMRLGSDTHLNVDVIPTGCLELDIALGVGGLPRGRVVEIFQPDSQVRLL